ncbi:hypothetical protein ABOM_005489 [Aspergillus bombycis]|uniref:AB hydrolase-1 domain-containing protein n=1 Tax=Aspergillus bombycis TaxID=109264 RepID=A0A1F8A288_9EURO|nr:hypothetical protein ABOM_005489 [Aspergillus bombycis]OGM45831.1 hypothetical protein ABOM_005489 [Aspergillus bombycis]
MSTQETANTLYLEVDDTKYAYRVIGNASDDSPPLLMHNHVRSTIDTWDPFVINNLTATGRQLITAFALNLLAFLGVLLPTMNIHQVDVLGFSMGRYIAQQVAFDAPDVVRKLVLAGTGPSFGPDLERPMNEVRSTVFNPTPGIPTIEAFFPSFTTGEQGLYSWHRWIM